MTTAIVLPGMGPTDHAMLGKLALVSPVARELFAAADETLGYRVLRAFRDSTDDYSEAAQVAFLTGCVAMAQWAQQELGIDAGHAVGPSFGGKTLAAVTGVLSFADTVALTAEICRVERQWYAGEDAGPALGLVTLSLARADAQTVAPVLAEVDGWTELSCEVDTDFLMITMPATAVEQVEKGIRALGGLPLYTMCPPMHSTLLAGLRDEVDREVLSRFTFADPAVPVVDDGTGELLTTGAHVAQLLRDGFVRPVRWPLALATLRDAGVTRLCIAGPDALFGRVRAVTSTFDVVAADPRRALRPVAAATA